MRRIYLSLSLSVCLSCSLIIIFFRFIAENIFFKFCFDVHDYYGGDGNVFLLCLNTVGTELLFSQRICYESCTVGA